MKRTRLQTNAQTQNSAQIDHQLYDVSGTVQPSHFCEESETQQGAGNKLFPERSSGRTERCTRCILPGHYPEIKFDVNGVCNRCCEWDQEFSQVDYQLQKKELDQLIERSKEEARRHSLSYDVVVPLSGGKDSAYVLYVLSKLYRCRILAVNYYNTFQTVQAYRNLTTLVNHFNVDFRMITIRPDLLKMAYRYAFETSGEFCLVCNCSGYWILWSFLNKLFASSGYIPLVTGGWSRLYEFDPRINTLDFRRYRDLLESSGLLNGFLEVLDQSVLDRLTGQADVRQQASGGFIQLPDYLPWEPATILQILKRQGWQPLKDKDTHFDCWASPLADALERSKYGVNQKTTIAAAYVRAGLKDRDLALVEDELDRYQLPDKHLIGEFSRHLDLPAGLVGQYLNLSR